MHLHNETPLLTGSIVRHGASVIAKGIEPQDYQNQAEIATGFDYAAAKLTTRFRLRIETARLVCILSGLGGAS